MLIVKLTTAAASARMRTFATSWAAAMQGATIAAPHIETPTNAAAAARVPGS